MVNVIFLDEQQLRKLAKNINYQEVEAIQSIQFKSEPEQGKCLGDSKACYKSVLALLDAGVEIEREYIGDDTRPPIARDIFSYLTKASNFSLQSMNDYRLRSIYLTKISDHSKTLIEELRNLNPADVTEVRALAEKAVTVRNIVGFAEPINRSNGDGLFDERANINKKKVFKKTFEAYGRGNVFANHLTKALGAVCLAVILFTAFMVWDIFSSKHDLRTATRNAVVNVASVGGAMLGEAVGAALKNALIGDEANPLFTLAAGTVISIAGASAMALIFDSGGNAPLSTDGHRCYEVSLPDGQSLARQIAHKFMSSFVQGMNLSFKNK